MNDLRFDWKKVSFKRYSARVGSLRIEVRRIGTKPNFEWMIGELLGRNEGDMHPQKTANRAMRKAEIRATELLHEASQTVPSVGYGTIDGSYEVGSWP